MTESPPEAWCFERKLRRFSISEGIPITPRTNFKVDKMTKLEVLKAEKESDYNLIQEDFAEIEAELSKTPVDKNKIQLIHTSLVNAISTFLIVHEKYREQLLKESNQSEFENEKRLEKTLNRKKLEIDMRCQKYLLRSPSTSGGGNSGGGADSYRMKLPKRELVTFDGDVRKWQPFWSSFEEIHLDPNIPEIQKFGYLVQTQEKDSSSATHIASFHFQADNYLKAIESLKDRYGRPKMLIKVYVRDLLKLVIDKSQNKAGNFEELVTKLTHQIRNLEALGVTTDKCEYILYPVVESCLPDDVYEAWQRSPTYVEKIDDLLKFLQQEVNNKMERDLAQSQFSSKKDEKASSSKSSSKGAKDKVKTASTLLVGEKKGKKEKPLCIFCDKNHGGLVCFAALNMSLATRQEIVKNKGHCIQCIKKGHTVAKCPGKVKCPTCKESHHPMMCPGIIPLPTREATAELLKAEEEAEVLKAFAKAGASKGGAVKTLVNQARSPDVPLQILNVLSHGTNGEMYRVRLIVDPGSQRTYTTTMMTDELKLPKVGEETIINDLFGGKRTEERTTPLRQLLVTALDGSNPVTFSASQVDTILRETEPTARGPWTEELLRKGIKIDDLDSTSPHIHILIGNDICAKIYTGKIVHLTCGVSAMETLFGWVLSGKIPPTKKTVGAYLVSTLISGDRPISDLWSLDTLGILDSTEKESRDELEKGAIEMFNKTVKVQDDGRYEVELPFYAGAQATLPSNFMIAKRRLLNATKKLKADGYLEAYDKVFKQWQCDQMIERCDVEPSGSAQYVELSDLSHYLPHRAVIKLSSVTTPIRPVFDASAKGKGTPSLNDCLEKGPNLLELIPAILTRFRMYEVGVVADIKKAFQQISISPKHRDYLKFLWWENLDCQKLMAYRHTRVVFGVSSSPFLLGATLQHHLQKAPKEFKEAAEVLKANMYVDNFVASTSSIEAAHRLQQQAQQLLLPAQFDLRGWEFGPIENEKQISVLGLVWNVKGDTLALDLSSSLEKLSQLEGGVAKQRKLLALCHSLFDPLGIISPFVLLGKSILRNCHSLKLGWDKELPTELQEEFEKWAKQIPLLADVRIPRYAHYFPTKSTLHVFGDASSLAATAAVFLRTKEGGAIFVSLIMCKPRLVPKKGTIPRFKLIAALFASRLAKTVRDFLQNADMEIHYWSDSTTALAWMQGSGPWGVFVTNRVNEIRGLTDLENWKHVPGNLNPADFPSRGGSVKKLLEKAWWEGPEWLKLSENHWPSSSPLADQNEVDGERKKVVVAAVVQENLFLVELSKYGRYTKVLRIIALVYRFIHGCQRRISVESTEQPAPPNATSPITKTELLAAEVVILRLVQQQFEDMKRLHKLQPFKDDEQIIRVKSRLTHFDTLDFLCPILLPGDNRGCGVRRCRLFRRFHRYPPLTTVDEAIHESYDS